MKQFFLILLCCMFLTQTLLPSSIDLIKEEYQAWVVFKKSDDLYVAKEYRYNNDPIFFAYSFSQCKFLETYLAESLWDHFDGEYERHLQNSKDTK